MKLVADVMIGCPDRKEEEEEEEEACMHDRMAGR
jgi:hypothetical protein